MIALGIGGVGRLRRQYLAQAIHGRDGQFEHKILGEALLVVEQELGLDVPGVHVDEQASERVAARRLLEDAPHLVGAGHERRRDLERDRGVDDGVPEDAHLQPLGYKVELEERVVVLIDVRMGQVAETLRVHPEHEVLKVDRLDVRQADDALTRLPEVAPASGGEEGRASGEQGIVSQECCFPFLTDDDADNRVESAPER